MAQATLSLLNKLTSSSLVMNGTGTLVMAGRKEAPTQSFSTCSPGTTILAGNAANPAVGALNFNGAATVKFGGTAIVGSPLQNWLGTANANQVNGAVTFNSPLGVLDLNGTNGQVVHPRRLWHHHE